MTELPFYHLLIVFTPSQLKYCDLVKLYRKMFTLSYDDVANIKLCAV